MLHSANSREGEGGWEEVSGNMLKNGDGGGRLRGQCYFGSTMSFSGWDDYTRDVGTCKREGLLGSMESGTFLSEKATSKISFRQQLSL